MNSIQENQAEENHRDLGDEEAIAKIKEIVEKAKSCFFCTTVATGNSNAARPMSVRQVDDDGNLWFLSARDSHKNMELALDSAVKLYFQGSAHSDFLELEGRATISHDKLKIKELWDPLITTWFTEGIDDPRITVIKVIPIKGYYWDTKHGNAVAGVKMLMGAILGRTMDDSIEGELHVSAAASKR
jgi:general stress protein 26